MRDALGQPPCVNEEKRGSMRIHEFHDALVNLSPHLVRRNRTEFRRWDFDSEVELALVTNVDDHGIGPRILSIRVTREKMGDVLDRLLRRGKPNTYGRAVGQRL